MFKTVISIIIPVYRVRKYLEACLDSLLDQDFLLPYNILLIESASDDGSKDICEDYQRRYHNVYHYHYDKNDGISVGRNLGLLHANGSYVIFMDGDDKVEKNFLSSLYQEVEKYPDVQLVSAGYSIYDDSTDSIIKHVPGVSYHGSGSKALEKLYSSKKYNPYCWAKLYKREFLLLNHLVFDSSMGMFEDMLFLSLVLANANEVSFIKKSIYLYRQHQESTVHTCKDWLTPHFECFRKVKKELHRYHKDLEKKIFKKPTRKIYQQIALDCEKSSSHYQKKKVTLYKEAKSKLKEIYQHELSR